MCITKYIGIQEFLENVFGKKVAIQYISKYSSTKKYAQIYTDGVYRNIKLKTGPKDVEAIGNLYVYLYKKYGFTNILGFT